MSKASVALTISCLISGRTRTNGSTSNSQSNKDAASPDSSNILALQVVSAGSGCLPKQVLSLG